MEPLYKIEKKLEVRIHNLSYNIKNEIILNDFTHTFKPGLNIIKGENGAGKTTLLNLIGGNLKTNDNEMSISGKTRLLNFIGGNLKTNDNETPNKSIQFFENDINISDEIMANRSKYIGFVFQDDFLIESLTFKENLKLPQRFLQKISREQKEISYSKIIGECEKVFKDNNALYLSKTLTKKPPKLSGGEKRKLTILRSIINYPKLLLLDEPTNHIDKLSIDWVISLIEKLVKGNVTIILVTHSNEFCSKLIKKVPEQSEPIVLTKHNENNT